MEKYAELLQSIEFYALLAEAAVEQLSKPYTHTLPDGRQVSIIKVFGPYIRPDKRSIVLLQDESGKTHTMSYPKWKVQKELGITLTPFDTIDHWDTNKENNSLDNLKVIDRKTHSTQDTRRVKLIDLECAECKKHFNRSPRLLRDKHKKGVRGVFCSRSCAARYSRKVQLGKADQLPVQDYMASEYYKAKYLKSEFIEYLLQKYAADLPKGFDPHIDEVPEDFEPEGLWEDVLSQYGPQPPLHILLQLLKEHDITAHAIGKTIAVRDRGGQRNILPATLKAVMMYLGY